MSKFAKALEQAQRDRALRAQPVPAPPAPPPPPTESPVPPVAPPPSSPPPSRPPPSSSAPRRIPAPRRRGAVPTEEVDSHLVSLVAPAGLEAEQYRALRHLVEQRHTDGDMSVIAVSSPGVGDGKTTTAINLAGALAQASDATVLLVEADLRRPSIGRLLGFEDSHSVGLVDAILDPRMTLADIVQPRPPYNLNVVLAGQTPASPYEVLQSPRLGALLDQAREQYRYIVMDTPPLAPVQDCRVVARWVDGIVLVVAADRTPRALLEAALDTLEPGKVLGIVFNGYDHLFSRRHARHYVGYYAEPESQKKGGAFSRATKKVGALFGRGNGAAVRNRRGRDGSH
jgi:capsular exopolysaccharide synthesis family protein